MKSHIASVFLTQIATELKRSILAENHAVSALQSPQSVKATPAKANAFQEMVRARLRERTNVVALAKYLKVKNPSVLYKRFRAGGSALCLDWLDEVTAFYQMSVSEMCALPGALWQQ